MSAAQQLTCSHARMPTPPSCSPSLTGRNHQDRKPLDRHFAASVVCQARGQSYHVEVEVSEDEDPEGVYKRFRNSCNLSGMVYEARRRKFFENPQDIKKRKQQEKGLRKMRDIRERFLQTYDDAHTDTPPFSELFAGDEDIYDVLGDGSFAEGQNRRSAPRQNQENRSRPPPSGRSNGAKGENVVMRSVPSDGPAKVAATEKKAKTDGKQKARVQTARTRRAAKQQAGKSKK